MLGNIIYADFIFKLPTIVFISGHADGDDIGIACIMQKCICIMNCTVYSIRIDIFEIGLILCSFICDFSVSVKHDKFVFIALIFNQNRIID